MIIFPDEDVEVAFQILQQLWGMFEEKNLIINETVVNEWNSFDSTKFAYFLENHPRTGEKNVIILHFADINYFAWYRCYFLLALCLFLTHNGL